MLHSQDGPHAEPGIGKVEELCLDLISPGMQAARRMADEVPLQHDLGVSVIAAGGPDSHHEAGRASTRHVGSRNEATRTRSSLL